jgi:hypothetical protein
MDEICINHNFTNFLSKFVNYLGPSDIMYINVVIIKGDYNNYRYRNETQEGAISS